MKTLNLGVVLAQTITPAAMSQVSDSPRTTITLVPIEVKTHGSNRVSFDSSWSISNSGHATTPFTLDLDGDTFHRITHGRSDELFHFLKLKIKPIFVVENSPGSVDFTEISGLSITLNLKNGKSIDIISQIAHSGAIKITPAHTGSVDVKLDYMHEQVHFNDIKNVSIRGTVSWTVAESSGELFGDRTSVRLDAVKITPTLEEWTDEKIHSNAILPQGVITIHQSFPYYILNSPDHLIASVKRADGRILPLLMRVLHHDEDTIIFYPESHISIVYNIKQKTFQVTNNSPSKISVLRLKIYEK